MDKQVVFLICRSCIRSVLATDGLVSATEEDVVAAIGLENGNVIDNGKNKEIGNVLVAFVNTIVVTTFRVGKRVRKLYAFLSSWPMTKPASSSGGVSYQ